jgi:glycosyltransferase involved in cell wall biosynthesis
MKKRVFIIGTHGFPARYGGFETLAENLSINLPPDLYDIIIFCSNKSPKFEKHTYKDNIQFFRLPLDASGYQGVLYDILSFVYTLFYSKSTILYLGPSIGSFLFIPRLRKHRIVTNFGGLNEWTRPKYEKIEFLLKLNFRLAAYFSNIIVCDNYVLQKSIKDEFNYDSSVIRYGGDHLVIPENSSNKSNDVEDKPYALVVARAQIDSMFELLIESWENQHSMNLIIVSNWEVSKYGVKIKDRVKNMRNIFAIGPIYDKEKLTNMRLGADLYIHSHSLCGTAPSLVESVSLGCPIICYDVETNREATKDRLFYFKECASLIDFIDNYDSDKKEELKEISHLLKEDFKWSTIVNQYMNII